MGLRDRVQVCDVQEATVQQSLDPCSHHVQRGGVEAAFRDDDVGVALGRFDEFQVHRPHGELVLLDHRFGRPTALGDIRCKPADEAHVGVRVHEDLDVEELPQRGVNKDQDALHQDHPARRDGEGPVGPAVGGEIVDRDFDGSAIAQTEDVLDEQFGLQGIRMVEIQVARWAGGRPLRSL